MIELYPYQKKAVKDIKKFFKSGGLHCILQSPTGSGKTVIFSHIAKKVLSKGGNVLILTDRTELLTQAGGSLENFGVKSYKIMAGVKYVNTSFNAFIAMAQTLRNRIDSDYWVNFLKTINLFIIDEAHKQDFNYLLESGLLEDKHLIGLTATPKRSGKMRQLGIDYEKIIETVSVRWLIKNKFLVNDDTYTVDGFDPEGVKIDSLTGDYQSKSVFSKFNSPKRYDGLIENYIELVPKSKALVFCVNIEHCIRTCIAFNEAGVKAKYIVSKTTAPKLPKNQTPAMMEQYDDRLRVFKLYSETYTVMSGSRDYVFHGHQNGNYPVLINAGIATTGYDDKSIETIILNRATMSSTLYLQMIGRGSRIFDNKTHFNILDFGGNTDRLGSYSEAREWNLWHTKSEGNGLPPIKTCGFGAEGLPILGDSKIKKGCERPLLASYKICPFCGFKYPEKKVKEIKLRLTKASPSIREMTRTELYTYWKGRGHKTAWLWRQLYYKGGKQEIITFGRIYDWKEITILKAIKFCSK